MDPFGPPRKKTRADIFLNGDGAYRGFGAASELDVFRYTPPDTRYRPRDAFATEREPLSTVLGSNSNACLKFFSTSGCPYGEGCHFAHYVPGGVSALGLTQSSNAVSVKNRSYGTPSTFVPEQNALAGGLKTRACKLFGTSEGCRFGDKCHFAHGDKDVRKLNGPVERELDRYAPPLDHLGPFEGRHGGLLGQREPTPGMAAAAAFGASSTAKISIDASLAGAIIGKGGVHQKQIRRVTGAKLAIRDHESDPNLKNVEMEGSFDQIKQASAMVRELLMHNDIQRAPSKPARLGPHNFKTKLCENYTKGTPCTFGDRCHFAHGDSELKQPPANA